jgi:hypothetical protein
MTEDIAIRHDLRVGDVAGQLLDIGGAGALDILGRLRVDRERDVLDARLALGRRYGDLFYFLRRGGRGQTHRQGEARCQERTACRSFATSHGFPP